MPVQSATHAPPSPKNSSQIFPEPPCCLRQWQSLGGYKLSSVLLSRLSPGEQRETAHTPKCLLSSLSPLTQHAPALSDCLTGCPPEHLFVITCLCLCLSLSVDPTVGLFTCLSRVHLPLCWRTMTGLPLHRINHPESILILNNVCIIACIDTELDTISTFTQVL